MEPDEGNSVTLEGVCPLRSVYSLVRMVISINVSVCYVVWDGYQLPRSERNFIRISLISSSLKSGESSLYASFRLSDALVRK